MRRYFFNVHNDLDTIDHEGMEFADLGAAIAHARLAARSLAADTVRQGHLVGHHRVEIVDGDGTLLHCVRFDEAVDIQP